MCTITLSYDPNNALARRKLAVLLSTGLFFQEKDENAPVSLQEQQEHRKEVEEFLYGSKVLATRAFARSL